MRAAALPRNLGDAPAWDGQQFQHAIATYYGGLISDALLAALDPPALAAAFFDSGLSPEQFIAQLDLDLTPLAHTLSELYGDAWVTGYHAGDLMLTSVGVTPTPAPWVKPVAQVAAAAPLTSDSDPVVNWDSWTPGNTQAAALLAVEEPGSGLGTLLNEAGVTIGGIHGTSLDNLSGCLEYAVEQGWGVSQTGAYIADQVGSQARGELIAQTEMARAMTTATLDSYKANSVTGKVWLLSDGACPLCEDNDADGEVGIDDEFTNGDPPVHPGCVCAVAPVTASGDIGEEDSTGEVGADLEEIAAESSFDQNWHDALRGVPQGTDAAQDWVAANGQFGEDYYRFAQAWSELDNDASAIARAALGEVTGDEVYDEAGALLRQFMPSAPRINTPAYRGGGWEGKSGLPEVGEEIQLRPSSFSYEQQWADNYAVAADDEGRDAVLFHTVGEYRGLPVEGLSAFSEEEYEVITGGRWVVDSIEVEDRWGLKITHIGIKAVL